MLMQHCLCLVSNNAHQHRLPGHGHHTKLLLIVKVGSACGLNHRRQHAMQGIQHLADAMGSYIRMGCVHFHAFPATCTPATTSGAQGSTSSGSDPIIKSDAVTISPVVLTAASDVPLSAQPPQQQQQDWLPNKRQRTDNQVPATLPVSTEICRRLICSRFTCDASTFCWQSRELHVATTQPIAQ